MEEYDIALTIPGNLLFYDNHLEEGETWYQAEKQAAKNNNIDLEDYSLVKFTSGLRTRGGGMSNCASAIDGYILFLKRKYPYLSKNNEKMTKDPIPPDTISIYKYRVELDHTSLRKAGDKYVVMFKGKPMLVHHPTIEFYEQGKLIPERVASFFEGTYGLNIINIWRD